MAAPAFVLGLLLMASGATAARDDGALPQLQLSGSIDAGYSHGSVAPPPPMGLMDIMSMSGCGRFAALVAATPTVSDVFQQRLLAGGVGGGGLTLFCPDEKAVDAFEATFRALPDSVRANVLLYHGAAARYVRAQLAGFDWVAVPTLAVADAATNKSQTVLARVNGDTMRLWPTWPKECVEARVTKTVSSSEATLVLHVVDAVLLAEKRDGGGDKAEVARGGYFRWLHYCVPLWYVLCNGVAIIAGSMGGAWLGSRGF